MDFKLTGHDINIINGDVQLCAHDKESIAQAITINLRTIAGEWFLDSARGLPYLTDIFGRKGREHYVRHIITSKIKTIAGIKDIHDCKIYVGSDRIMHINFAAILNDNTALTINEAIEIVL